MATSARDVTPEKFVAGADAVVALGQYSGTFKATGRSFAAPFVHVWKLRDGKVAAFRQHTDTAVVQRAMQSQLGAGNGGSDAFDSPGRGPLDLT